MAFWVEFVALPDVAGVLLAVFVFGVLSDAKHKHCFLVFKFLKVKDGRGFINLWVVEELWFQQLFVFDLVLIQIHLFDNRKTLSLGLCLVQLKERIIRKSLYRFNLHQCCATLQ